MERAVPHRGQNFIYFLRAPFFFGIFAPDLRASDRPMAIACLRLFTRFPERPLLSLPRFISCMARLTLRLPLFLLVAVQVLAGIEREHMVTHDCTRRPSAGGLSSRGTTPHGATPSLSPAISKRRVKPPP
jgi:hypothetical protein